MCIKNQTNPTYNSWRAMKARCLNPKDKSYQYYGGRGIEIHYRWLNFDNFLSDMGERPEGMTLDRRDTEGDYCLNNCKWSTVLEQRRNMRSNINIEIDGISKTAKEWAIDKGIYYQTLINRLNRGWDHERAVLTPVRKMTRSRP